MPRVFINASNLHVGGGVQVAVSFINELLRSSMAANKFTFFASTEVHENLLSIGCDISRFSHYEVVNIHGVEVMRSKADGKLDQQDTVFTLFGPLYRLRPPFKCIVGFGQSWIIYPNNECYAMLPFIVRLKTRLKYWVQAQFFKRADILVVELEHVKQGLIRELGIPAKRIHVVHNCISSIYLDETVWQTVEAPKLEGYLRLGFLGRNYLHKNTAVFPAIADTLEQQHGLKVRFYVTFTEQEWAACTPEFRAVCINVGPLSVAQCPRFYQALDGVVFPSLLECFSATPLEALAMEKPLFASDRSFNRDICGLHAHYFDPLSPATAAQAIANVFNGAGPNPEALRVAREHAIHFSSPKERAEKYLTLLMSDTNV